MVTAVLLCSTVLAAEVTIDVTDSTVWKPVESTLTAAQADNLPRVDSSVCIGFILNGNAFEVNKKINFGEGLSSISTQFSAAIEPGVYADTYPDVKLLVRIDSVTGPIIAELYPDSAGTGLWVEPIDAAKTVITDAGKTCKSEHSVFLEVVNDYIADGKGYNIWPIILSTKQVGSTTSTTATATTTLTTSNSSKTSNAASPAKTTSNTLSSSSIGKSPSPTIAKLALTNSNNKYIILIIVGVVVIAGAVAAILYFKQRKIK